MIYKLSRYEYFKKTYLQLGNIFKLPKDIIIYIYNITLKLEKKELEYVRDFYNNIIILHLESPSAADILMGSGLHPSKSDINVNMSKWKNKYYDYINNDLNSVVFPDIKGIEWFIKHYSDRLIARNKIIDSINIIGESGYLYTNKLNFNGDHNFIEADIKTKIKYLNTNPWDEIELDYNSYKEWSYTDHQILFRIYIDEYGDGGYIN